MFEKKILAFTNKDIFGLRFKPSIDSCFCVVSKMLFSGKIDADGTLDVKKEVMLTKRELWSYIYYLFYHNHESIDVFKSMKNEDDGKASAEKFYETVLHIVLSVRNHAKPIEIRTLISFVNKVIKSHATIVNPIFDYLKLLMGNNTINRISGVTMITGKDGKTGFKIVTDPKEVQEANVKISIISDR